MNYLANYLTRPLGWFIVWILISSVFMIAQTVTPESNRQAIVGQNFRLVRLEQKIDNISDTVATVKFINEKIDHVAENQNFIILSVLGALCLNLFNTFKKRRA